VIGGAKTYNMVKIDLAAKSRAREYFSGTISHDLE
jgi:hypothetical protein